MSPQDTFPFRLFTTDSYINIDHITANILEHKLNKLIYSKGWGGLGNILYKWSNSPPTIDSVGSLSYKVTPSQLSWIKDNSKIF